MSSFQDNIKVLINKTKDKTIVWTQESSKVNSLNLRNSNEGINGTITIQNTGDGYIFQVRDNTSNIIKFVLDSRVINDTFLQINLKELYEVSAESILREKLDYFENLVKGIK